MLLCFFKQKTAYEMRISDWSSDVCSSDLAGAYRPAARGRPGDGGDLFSGPCGRAAARDRAAPPRRLYGDDPSRGGIVGRRLRAVLAGLWPDGAAAAGQKPVAGPCPQAARLHSEAAPARLCSNASRNCFAFNPPAKPVSDPFAPTTRRSEEHTSELPALMRLSY